MNILIAHHFSDHWENEFKKYNTDFDNEMNKLIDFVKNKNIDKIILPLFESHQLKDCHQPLIEICQKENILIEVHEYGYGWKREDDNEYAKESFPDEDFNKKWIYGTRDYHTEEDILIIEDWQKNLKNDYIYLTGAFHNECVKDMEEILNHLDIQYEAVESLIVGSGIEYHFIGKSPENIYSEIKERLEEINDNIDNILEEENLYGDVSCLDDLFDYLPDLTREVEEQLVELYTDYEDDIENINFYDFDEFSYGGEFLIESIENGYAEYEYKNQESSLNSKLHSLLKDLHSDNFYDRYNILRVEDDYSLDEIILFNPEIDTLYGEVNSIVNDFKKENSALSNEEILNNLKEKDFEVESAFYFKLIELSIENNYEMFKNIIKKKHKYKTEPNQSFYRGILIEENADIDDISCANSDYNCIYISNEYDVALNFSQDEEKSVILDLSMSNENNIIILPVNSNHSLCINSIEYHLSDDREEYFKALENLGYDGCVVEQNYGNGDDIALFNENLLSLNNFQIKENDLWNEYKNVNELESSKSKKKKKVKIN